LVGIGVLSLLNLRGVKTSPIVVWPIFATFVITHGVLIAAAFVSRGVPISPPADGVSTAALYLLVRAYAFGAATYTGIETVSHSVPVMREPKIATAKRTMLLVAISLAVLAGGIIAGYSLLQVGGQPAKTLNAVFAEQVVGSWSIGGVRWGAGLAALVLFSEGALLLFAAQSGFTHGPRVMANMATDSWLPHRFSALSDRLTMRNGVLLMTIATLGAIFYTRGDLSRLVVMYIVAVFVTFSLSNVAMIVSGLRRRGERGRKRQVLVHGAASVLCLSILGVVVFEKLTGGAGLTLVMIAALLALCFLIRRHYQLVSWAIDLLDVSLPGPERGAAARRHYSDLLAEAPEGEPPRGQPVAVLFVGRYSALGRTTLATLLRMFPDHFKGVVFVSIAIVDSGTFKGVDEIEALEKRTRADLELYEAFGRALGLPSASMTATGTEIAIEAHRVATELVAKYPQAMIVAGQLIFEEDTLWNRMLHNETAFLIQRRLQRDGIPMVVLPVLLDVRSVDPWRRRGFFAPRGEQV
jgi:hypothetical protein